MRVVIDTNIVTSAIWRDRLPEAVILYVLDHPDFEWVASPDIVTEYAAVLARPKFALTETTLRR
jgi:predicted nucleic acid-binding protein